MIKKTGKSQTSKANVTVVVPVYGDWDSLSQCIDSLIKNLKRPHQVLLVNDCGPDADSIEQDLLKAIVGHDNFTYERNKQNLGFVQTCNRAVFELDKSGNDILLLNSDTIVTANFLEEMLEVLYLSDRHAITFPRSNNATIATVPLHPIKETKPDNDIKYGYKVYQAIKQYLPRYAVVPTGVGFCLLIKRQIIDNFGLFDTNYNLGYHEENDFCQRVNQYGYSIVISNHAFVFHLESRSFSADKKRLLNEENEKKLLKKYPYYSSLVRRYTKQEIHPVDHFADIIGNLAGKQKLLINLYHFPAAFNGTTKTGHSLLRYLKDFELDSNIEVTIFTQPESDSFHNLASYGFRIVYPKTIGDEVFNVGYCPGQIFHAENLLFMNRHCYKNIFSLLDIIALRCEYLRANDDKLRSVFYDSIVLANRIVSISEFTKRDVSLYFTDLSDKELSKIQPVHMGFPGHTFDSVDSDCSVMPIAVENIMKTERYVLVFGNDFKHKAIDKVIEKAAGDPSRNYILLGPHAQSSLPHNIAVLSSGDLSDSLVDRLLDKSKIILFPSQYEGFGFPILEAAKYKKPLVYFSNETSEEIVSLSKYNHTFAFQTFEDLLNVIELAWQTPPITETPVVRELSAYNQKVVDIILGELETTTPDINVLEARWSYFSRMSDYYYRSLGTKRHSLKIRSIKFLQRTSPKTYLYLRSKYRQRK